MVATSKFGLLTVRQHNATKKHLFLYPQGDRSGLRKPKKEQVSTLITATTSVHLHKLVSTDLTIKSDLVLTNAIGKCAKLVDVIKHLPQKVFLSRYYHSKGGEPKLKRHLLPMT